MSNPMSDLTDFLLHELEPLPDTSWLTKPASRYPRDQG